MIELILFFIISFLLGYSLIALLKLKCNPLLYFGIGWAVWGILGLVFSLVHIPLTIYGFMLLSLIVPVWKHIVKRDNPFKDYKFEWKQLIVIAVILLALTNFYFFYQGTLTMPKGLSGDGDYQRHIANIYYIENNAKLNPYTYSVLVSPPYPQVYHIIIGTTLQLGGDLLQTTNIINLIFIAYGIITIFFFLRKYVGDWFALFGSFVMLAIPCFLTRFIWPSSLALVLIPLVFYALEKIKEDKKWWILSSILIAGILCIQISNAFNLGLLFIIYLIFNRKMEVFLAGVVGVGIALVVFYIPQILTIGFGGVMEYWGFSTGNTLISVGGEVMTYGLRDYITALPYGKIDNLVGIGIFLSLLAVIGVIYIIKSLDHIKKYGWVIGWLIVSIMGTQGLILGFFPHRWHACLAISVCILATFGLMYLIE